MHFSDFIKIRSIINNSKVNGPGNRLVIWMQGCSLNCPNCFNPETHSFKKGDKLLLSSLFEIIINEKNIDGITISGGEPFQQADKLFKLTKMVRENTKLSQIIYSGYTINEIKKHDKMKKILSNIDVLIDGRFNSKNLSNKASIGSANQKHHFFSDRYSINDFQQQNALEYHFENDGLILLTGFPKGI